MRVLVAGSSGLVGSAVVNNYLACGHEVLEIHRPKYDLLNRSETFDFIKFLSPDLIVDCAALVGGINFNSKNPVEFLSNNLQIQCNLMDAALAARVYKFIFLGSSCIYPRESKQPIKEEYLMTGPLEQTNSAYAIAKIAGIEAVKAARRQYGLNWISIMPTNVYGPRDNFSMEKGHVVPALIRKFIEAKQANQPSIKLWGDGSAMREFIHSSDLAEAIKFVQENYNEESHINVGVGSDITIKELADLIADIVNFKGEIEWDLTKPNGTPRKLLDNSKLRDLGWTPKVNLEKGLKETIDWFNSARIANTVRL